MFFFYPKIWVRARPANFFFGGRRGAARPPDTTRPSIRCFSSSEWALPRKDQPLKNFFKCPPAPANVKMSVFERSIGQGTPALRKHFHQNQEGRQTVRIFFLLKISFRALGEIWVKLRERAGAGGTKFLPRNIREDEVPSNNPDHKERLSRKPRR